MLEYGSPTQVLLLAAPATTAIGLGIAGMRERPSNAGPTR